MRRTTLLLVVLSACDQSTTPVATAPEPAGVTWTRSAIAPASITTLPTVIAEVNGGAWRWKMWMVMAMKTCWSPPRGP